MNKKKTKPKRTTRKRNRKRQKKKTTISLPTLFTISGSSCCSAPDLHGTCCRCDVGFWASSRARTRTWGILHSPSQQPQRGCPYSCSLQQSWRVKHYESTAYSLFSRPFETVSVSIQFFTYIPVLDDLDKSVILLLFASHGNVFLDLQTLLAYVPTAPTLSVS